MQILSADQIRAWDEFTILNEPVPSIDLMERAANACYEWFMQNNYKGKIFSVFCGKGNNGGDGLAIARMLAKSGHKVIVYILEFGHKGTEDFQTNLGRLHQTTAEVRFVSNTETIPEIPKDDVMIDALLGSGLNRPLEGLTAELVEDLNENGNEIISIDIPSGLLTDKSSKGNIAITAHHTLSFQCYKPAFLVSENEKLIGNVHILDIGLHPGYLAGLRPQFNFIDKSLITTFFKPRKRFAHKGHFGHALLIVGSYGKMGAAVLAAKACLRAGVGLLTVHIPEEGYSILQTAVPEAMVEVDANKKINTSIGNDLSRYNSIGIGPGLGMESASSSLIMELLHNYKKPIVLDADALNLIGKHPSRLTEIPPNSIVTPHPKEFERLFGITNNDFESLQLAMQKAKQYNLIVVLKGHHTFIATPLGANYFNSSGNAGMAKGGSGDVLTGIITALIAQQYSPEQSAILGAYIHGIAGDRALEYNSYESLVASDIIDWLADAFRQFY